MKEGNMAKKITRTANVRCRGGSSLLEGIDRGSLPGDCSEILKIYPDGISRCRYGCLGGGSCAAACRLAAIQITEGAVANVDISKCVGCGLCVRACPQNLIELVPKNRNIQPECSNCDTGRSAADACGNSCIACRICEKNCPAEAIHVIDGRAVIDMEKCICCGMCAVKCPRGVIRDMHGVMTD